MIRSYFLWAESSVAPDFPNKSNGGKIANEPREIARSEFRRATGGLDALDMTINGEATPRDIHGD